MLTLYKLKRPDEEIMSFCRSHALFGVTMHEDRVTPAALKKFADMKLPLYVHTINDYNTYIKVRDMGAYGVYTDYFEPGKWIE